MEKVSYWRAMGEIEKLVKESIPGSHPKSWEVHALTQRLLLGLQSNLQGAPITGFRSDFTVECTALRRRPAEEAGAANGAAIAVVTRIANRDGTLLEGASFLEARIKSDRKRTFEAFTQPQLRKSLRGSPSTHLLLLDYEDITAYSSNRSVAFPAMEYSPWRGGLPVTPCTYAVVSPLNVVLAQHLNDTSLYRFSLPLSFQLVYRYWHGFDLDPSEQALQAARGFTSHREPCSYLLAMTVVEDGAEPPGALELERSAWRPLE